MVLLAPAPDTPLAEASSVDMYVAGAESNVAGALAHLGHRVEWFGRVGLDPFGARVRRFLDERGVETSRVIVDEARPTGVYFKDRIEDVSHVYYYRTGSAASALSRRDVLPLTLPQGRLIHLSGITPALSPTCDDLLQSMILERSIPGMTISFDINYRPTLWEPEAAAERLVELARASDIVIVGRDEADELWATRDAAGVRRLLPDVPVLIVKDAGNGATHFDADGSTFVPAVSVEVVEAIGAGDAFAAGFLSGWLRGWSPKDSLRLGHVMAAFTLQHMSDMPALPDATSILPLVLLVDEEWNELDLALPSSTGASPSAR
jgi:2-dehydro-3-deoxygluconokinase